MKKRTIKHSPAALVFLHSLWAVLILISLSTGLRIQADEENAFSHLLSPVLPQGDVFFWHTLSGAVLGALFFAYLFYYVRSRKRLAPIKKHLFREPLHVIAYALLIIVTLCMLISGFFNVMDWGGKNNARIHTYCAYSLMIFIALHTLAHIRYSGILSLVRIIRPTKRLKWLASTVCIAMALSAFGVYFLFLNAKPLHAHYTQAHITIDGHANEADWKMAHSVSVMTQHGDHLHQGRSLVRAKALYDDDYIYLHITWQDPTRSQKHLPLVKTHQGWQIQKTQFLLADERSFYEDKFAVLLADGDPFANKKSIHLGKSPLKDQPNSLNHRGLHYTTNGKIYDLWHWQSVRSNAYYQADDSYFGAPFNMPKNFPKTRVQRKGGTFERYTAGYYKDPPITHSGIDMNWESKFTPFTQPRRLPVEKDDILHLQSASLKPHEGDAGPWWLTWDDTQPYTLSDDDYPIGTLLPSVLIKTPREGDRGNVSARGYWAKGLWHLEMKRALNTGSKYDVAVDDVTYLWFAVFDHTQTRHSRHMRPIKLILKHS